MGPGEDVAGLVAIIDQLEALLERSALTELEIEADGTTIILRSPAAIAVPMPVGGPGGPPGSGSQSPVHAGPSAVAEPGDGGRHVVRAPLTGVFYRSPSPGAEPYLREGGQVNAGQVIGLIEAMKLFNEIKSDVTGVVRAVVAAEGALVKARDVLIEVDAP